MAIRIELTHDSHSPTFIPGSSKGKLKMSFKVGEHGATAAGGFNSGTNLCFQYLQPPVVEASWMLLPVFQ